MDKYIQKLLREEKTAVTKVMAFMSYNPSIGRVLEKRGVVKFQKLMVNIDPQLREVRDRTQFDDLHAKFVEKIIADFKTSRGTAPTYGQAQKPVNVFFKVYIDWAGKPDQETGIRLVPFLHVPLDSILMKTIKRHSQYGAWYEREIKPYRTSVQQEFSLSKIDRAAYLKWQQFFRDIHPDKPLIFDIAWALNRK